MIASDVTPRKVSSRTNVVVGTGEVVVAATVVEVGAVVDDVDHDVGAALGRGGGVDALVGGADRAQALPGGCLVLDPGKLDQHGAGGRHEVVNAG